VMASNIFIGTVTEVCVFHVPLLLSPQWLGLVDAVETRNYKKQWFPQIEIALANYRLCFALYSTLYIDFYYY